MITSLIKPVALSTLPCLGNVRNTHQIEVNGYGIRKRATGGASGSGKEIAERQSKDVPFSTIGALSEKEEGSEGERESGKERAGV
jgi:hypothetical protein